MDWLDKYKVVLMCEERTVSLETDLGRIAKVMCANSGIHLSSLFHGIETSQEKVEDIDVVQDFADAFEEVKCLPQHREIEFLIDLIPRAVPVIQPSRRMAPREREELIKQTQNLLEKGLIRPSFSCWGSAAVFVTISDGSLRFCVDY